MRGKPLPVDLMDQLLALEGVRCSLNTLYEAVDDALYYGHEAQQWDDIELLMADPRWSELSLTMLIGGLIITLPIKDKLKNRGCLVKLVEQHPEALAEGRVDRLLSGLV